MVFLKLHLKKAFPLFFALLGIVSFLACSATVPTSEHNHIPLNDLLSQVPTQNAVKQKLVMQAILEHGEAGILELCSDFQSNDKVRSEKAAYALNGLAAYVGKESGFFERQIVLDAIHKVLSQISTETKTKIFLLEQLKLCADVSSIEVIKPMLGDAGLCADAVQSLASIGSPEVGQVMTEALTGVSSACPLNLIHALGEIRYEPAADQIFLFLDHNDKRIKETSLFTLANLAYQPAEQQIRKAAGVSESTEHYYLTYASRLAQQGKTDHSLKIARDIMENSSSIYSTSARISALTLLCDLLAEKAVADLINVVTKEDHRMQTAALNLAEPFKSPQAIDQWIELAKNSQPEKQSRIIEMLGRQGSEHSVGYLRESVGNSDSSVKLSALSALFAVQGHKAEKELLQMLKQPSDQEPQDELKLLIETHSDSSSIERLMTDFEELPASSKIILIEILQQQDNRNHNSRLTAELKSDQAELRLKVLQSFLILGNDTVLDELLNHAVQTNEKGERKQSLRVAAVIINRSADKRKHLNELSEIFKKSESDDQVFYLQLFSKIGDGHLIGLVSETLNAPDDDVKDAAMNALLSWPDPSAMSTLLKIAKSDQLEKNKILAIRSALRIIRENPMGDRRAYLYYKKLFELSQRPEEKRLVIAGLATVETPGALKLLSDLIDDQEIGYEAFIAAMQIASMDKENEQNLQSDEVALALMQSEAKGELSQKIKSYAIENSHHNQPPQGFTALFNGLDLTSWKGLVQNPPARAKMSAEELTQAQAEADKIMHEHWMVVDGVLYFKGVGFHNICTFDEYENFELLIDWKIEKDGDSGLYLRGVPQVQIWDPTEWNIGSGGLYNNQKNLSKPVVIADKPIGEWNTFRIIMINENVTVYLNDILVVDKVELENYWERDKVIYSKGQIELQAHNSPLYFRNIFIRELPVKKPLFDGLLFNGKDLSGWQLVNSEPGTWKIQDGILYTDGSGGGWLSTETEYSDFKLELEFRVPEGGNSGVFLRAPHSGDPAYSGMEIQVLDDYAEKYADLKEWQYTGSIYGIQAPSERVTKKNGDWQKMEITCAGPNVQVVLNGKKINDANLIDYMDQEQEHPGIKRRKGYIGLQNHSTRIEYKNIRLTELEK